MENDRIEYSIVIPVYRSGDWLDEVVRRIGAVMETEAPGKYELVLVDDCSSDLSTWQAIQRNAQCHDWVRGCTLLYNVGQFRTTLCGLEQARGRYILCMDDDLQDPPEEIPKLLHAIRQDEETLCVMGCYESGQRGWVRSLGSRMIQGLLNRIYGKPPGIQNSSFRIMRRELAEAILSFRTARPQMGPLILSLTRKVKNVPVCHEPRPHGRSGYGLWRLLHTTVDSVVNASTAPLRFFSAVGFFSAAVSLLIGLFFFFRWLAGGIGVAGFMSQVLLISFFGGMMLTGIGVLGEYVARIITELTGPERYRIRARAGLVPPGDSPAGNE